jgi:hypothetical protein
MYFGVDSLKALTRPSKQATDHSAEDLAQNDSTIKALTSKLH